jgi:hypothetical protein
MKDQPTCIIYPNGTKTWLLDGQRHRLDGPAVEYADGDRSWLQYGIFHREDGPAMEYFTQNHIRWLWRGKYLPVSNQEEFERLVKMKAFW